MYQKVTIIGNVGSLEPKFTPSGLPVTTATVATSYFKPGRDGAQGTNETEWWNVELWQNSAEKFAEKCHVGDLVFVEGRLKTEKWDDKEGVHRERKKLVAENWRLLKARNVTDGPAVVEESADEEERLF